MIEVGRMLKRRFENIITYLRHQVTNAASESINAKIHWVKYTARDPRAAESVPPTPARPPPRTSLWTFPSFSGTVPHTGSPPAIRFLTPSSIRVPVESRYFLFLDFK